jgi:hypothetical protein
MEVLPAAGPRMSIDEDPLVVNKARAECTDQEQDICKTLVSQVQAFSYSLFERGTIDDGELGTDLHKVLVDQDGHEVVGREVESIRTIRVPKLSLPLCMLSPTAASEGSRRA